MVYFRNYVTFRNNRSEVFSKIGVFKNFPKFPGKHLCQSLFFNKVGGLRPAIKIVESSGHFFILYFINEKVPEEIKIIFVISRSIYTL